MRSDLPISRGDARLYHLDPPMVVEEGDPTCWVIVAAIRYRDGQELTDVFPANAEGEVTRWLPQEGSLHDRFDHDDALKVAGYEVVS